LASSFSIIFKFLPDQIIFQRRDDQDFLDRRHRQARQDPALHNLGLREEGQRCKRQDHNHCGETNAQSVFHSTAS
jgi:hypothetical protein